MQMVVVWDPLFSRTRASGGNVGVKGFMFDAVTHILLHFMPELLLRVDPICCRALREAILFDIRPCRSSR